MKRPFKFNGELKPLPTFLNHAKNRERPRKQAEALERGYEKIRELATVASHGRCNAHRAHSLLDDFIAICEGGQTRLADIHIRDTGVTHTLAKAFEEASVFTLTDLANCCVTKLPASLDILDALTVTITALRRVLDLEQERMGA